MGKKKKQKRRHSNKQKIKNLPVDELISRGDSHIRSGRFREAIGILKQAVKKGGDGAVISPLLFAAYLNREKQLRAKGMTGEADAIHKHVAAYMPDPDSLPEPMLTDMIADCPVNEAFLIYNDYLKKKKSFHPQIERILAGRLVQTREWQLIDLLSSENRLNKETPGVREAVCLMESGQWEKALPLLHSIGRKSPYSDIRLFCRAMVEFYAGNDEDMKRALSMLPDGFVLKSVARTMETAPEDLACLWNGKNHCETEMAGLLSLCRQGREAKAAAYAETIGRYLCPDDSYLGVNTLIEYVWAFSCQKGKSRRGPSMLAKKTLPKDMFAQLMAKLDFLEFDYPMADAGAYLSVLNNEYDDPKERDIAKSMVLIRTAEYLLRNPMDHYRYSRDLDEYVSELGISSGDPTAYITEMAHTAVCLDPSNPEAYVLLSKTPRSSKKVREIVEDGFLMMKEKFPDDPYPCLELADLYYESNAFRKAETILHEAVARAPHDRRVEERRQLSLLISADQSIKRGRFRIAKRDIELALDMKNPKTVALAVEKQIVYTIENTGQLSLFDNATPRGATHIKPVLERHIGPLPAFDRLRVLGLLLMEYREKVGEKYSSVMKDIEKVYRVEIREASRFTSNQIREMLTPLGRHIRPLMRGHNIAREFLSRSPALVKQVDDGDIFTVFEFMIAARLLTPCLKEIRRRLKTAPEESRDELKFYETAIRHFAGELFDDADAFLEIIGYADPAGLERLRRASRRLSSFAGGDLRIAMETFNFDYLDDFPEPFYDDDDDDMPPGPFDIRPESMTEEFFMILEMLIDGMNLRGAPARVIKKFAQKAMIGDDGFPDMEEMAHIAANTPALMDNLSREAKIVLFGKA